MAATFTFVSEDVWGKEHVYTYDFVADTSYPAGGYGTTTGVPANLLPAYKMHVGAAKGTVASSILYTAILDVATPTSIKVRLVSFASAAEATGNVSTIGFRLSFYVR